MRKLLIPLLAAFALPTAVNAEVVHLDCYWPKRNGSDKKTFEIALNEKQGIVSREMGYFTKKIKTFPAVFNSQNILFTIAEDYLYEINRTNGQISLKYKNGEPILGNCKKVKTMF